MLWLHTSVVLSCLSQIVLAQPDTNPGPGPIITVVESTMPEKGHAVLTRFVQVLEQIPVVEKINVNDKVEERVVHRSIVRTMAVSTIYDISASRVITTDGKQLSIDEVWKRLKPKTAVAISTDFKTPNAVYLRALNPEVLVIIPQEPKLDPMPKKK